MIGVRFHRVAAFLAALAACTLGGTSTGCDVDPYCLDCVEESAMDAGTDAGLDASRPDARVPDAGSDAGPDDAGPPLPDGCAPGAVERCNDFDDDCDLMVDEGIDTQSNPEHCGGCNMRCAPAHALGVCTDGTCSFTECDVGYYDLDPAMEGCEYRCAMTDPDDVRCDLVDNDCDGTVDEDIAFQSDPANCGSCGRTCRFAHAMGSCVADPAMPADPRAALCVLGACDEGFADADGNPANGCEYACIPSATAVETCNLRDDDCDGNIDEGDPGGGATCGISTGECTTGIEHCVGGAVSCTGNVTPTVELCNGLDDDCDGSVDQGNPEGGRLCGTGTGACEPGREVCTSGALVCQGAIVATPETCNGLDDDCDGMIDDGDPGGGGSCGTATGECVSGIQHCRGGVIACEGAVGPAIESCNGRDDDCDGTVDDGNPGGGGSCGSDTGACTAGNRVCTGGMLVCTGGTGATTEACNALDDDCDGRVDEGNPGGGAACGDGTGECAPGMRTCVAGALACVGAVGPATESCNGLDDDCDGMVDDGNPGGGGTCGTDIGACNPGTRSCAGGTLVCTGAVGPALESCNAIDDDCDSNIDEGNPGGGMSCGTDAGECTAGVRTCVAGGFACVGQVTGTPETCDMQDDDCDGMVDEGFSTMGSDVRNCGMCGRVCTFPFAIPRCTAGTCGILACETGHYDLDGTLSNGCEYACSVAGAEACNGRDDDCDGSIDESLTPPAMFCNPNGVCAGTAATCGGAAGWTCSYPATHQPTENRCDGLDNDCDGTRDEGFAGLGDACDNGSLGVCRVVGMRVCNAAGTGTVCNAGAGPASSAELCDNLDNDCDGTVDDGAPATWVQFRSGSSDRWIFAYEASRPDATGATAGTRDHRVCSEPSRLPWTNITHDAAEAECAAIGARLCTETEWRNACRAGATCRWSYESACTTYSSTTCNGNDYDANGAGAGNTDAVLPTGTLPMCYADWDTMTETRRAYDMSGNIEEWTAERSSGVNPIRGGSMNDTAGGMECDFDFLVAGETFQAPTVGFRCCRGTAP